jgi:general secretion pathway protein H
MAVMMIVALASALALSMAPGTGRAGLKASVLETVALLRRERQSAMLSGRHRDIGLDPKARVLIGESGGIVRLPQDVAFEILGMDAYWGVLRAVVRFHPDGASTGAVLRFTRDRATYEVRVNWLTGGVGIDAN